ncbi:MAG: ParB N-terminal domain-containing protein [Armatimonadota bacterium]|nr:ParB N-terminal domain-containing protein [Armatimonadota bacterium]
MTNNKTGKAIENVRIDQLFFDPENPRLPANINRRDEQAVLEYMLRDGSVLELMQSIGEKGYFAGEPLLAIESTGRPGFYEVVEGNRRLCAAKLLLHPEIAPVRQKSVEATSSDAKFQPDTLPIIVYDRREDILDYLGYRHITGIKQWDSLAKARYLEQLQATYKSLPADQQYRTLAKIIGSRPDYVASLLTSLALYDRIEDQNFFGLKAVSPDSVDFSLLTTALSYNNIVQFLGLQSRADPGLAGLQDTHLKELTQWMFEKGPQNKTRLGESRNLKQLNSIVSEKRALEAFRNGKSLQEAVLLTKAPAESFSTALVDAKSRLQTAFELIHVVSKPQQTDVQALQDIQQLSRDLRTIVVSRIAEPEDEDHSS